MASCEGLSEFVRKAIDPAEGNILFNRPLKDPFYPVERQRAYRGPADPGCRPMKMDRPLDVGTQPVPQRVQVRPVVRPEVEQARQLAVEVGLRLHPVAIEYYAHPTMLSATLRNDSRSLHALGGRSGRRLVAPRHRLFG